MQSPLCAGWGWKEGEQAGGWDPPPTATGVPVGVGEEGTHSDGGP